MKSIAGFILILMIFSSCSSDNSVYSEQKRREMTREANTVITAVFQKIFKVEKSQQIDMIEGRKGFSKKIEKGVTFKTKEVLKGSFGKTQFAVGVELPKMAFGIDPGEYSGQKKYTFYLINDKEQQKDKLIGAEWETPKY